MNAISKYRKELIAAGVLALLAFIAFVGIQAKTHFDQVAQENADNAAAVAYMQKSDTSSAYSLVLGSTDAASEQNFGLSWTGQMGITVTGAEYFESLDAAIATYPQLVASGEEEYFPNAGYLICKFSLKNISAVNDYQARSSVFSASIFRLSAPVGQNYEAAQAAILNTTGSIVLFDGTYDNSDYKGFYNFEVEPGQTKVLTCGFACGPEVKTLVDGASDTFAISVGADGATPVAYLGIPGLG